MRILDWFKNRPAQFDPECVSGEMSLRSIDKAVTLTNPRLKLLPSYQERLAPAVEISLRYMQDLQGLLPPSLQASETLWSSTPLLRACFANARDIPEILSRSHNLQTLFGKYSSIERAHLILGMGYLERSAFGMAMLGDVVQRDVPQKVLVFSDHQVRICAPDEAEVRRLLCVQLYEYLLAQALSVIGEERSERRELEDNRVLILARLRLLQQQGPGLGSVFGSAPGRYEEQLRLEAQLLDNERQIELIGSPRSVLEKELDCLRDVLEHPQRYIRVEKKVMWLNTLNVVVDASQADVATDISFCLAHLNGVQPMQRAFLLATFDRSEMLDLKLNFDKAERYL